MKKTVFAILSIFVMNIFSLRVLAVEDIKVYLNGERLSFEQSPIIRNDSTLVPFRAIFEKLDMTVQWFGNEKRVTAEKEGAKIDLYIDSTEMKLNGSKVELNAPPVIYNDFTMVPLRAVSEAAGADVDWDGETRTIRITTRQSDFEEWAKRVLELTNEERRKMGMYEVEWDEKLAETAKKHCEDMIRRNFFSHENPDGKTPFDRITDAGLSYWLAGENIGAGQYSPEKVVEEWMNSETHRANILNPLFFHMGAAVVKGGEYGIYWVQEFAWYKDDDFGN